MGGKGEGEGHSYFIQTVERRIYFFLSFFLSFFFFFLTLNVHGTNFVLSDEKKEKRLTGRLNGNKSSPPSLLFCFH